MNENLELLQAMQEQIDYVIYHLDKNEEHIVEMLNTIEILSSRISKLEFLYQLVKEKLFELNPAITLTSETWIDSEKLKEYFDDERGKKNEKRI